MADVQQTISALQAIYNLPCEGSVKKPPLTEKYITRPPFKYLHELVTAVQKITHFAPHLFNEQENNPGDKPVCTSSSLQSNYAAFSLRTHNFIVGERIKTKLCPKTFGYCGICDGTACPLSKGPYLGRKRTSRTHLFLAESHCSISHFC